MEYAPVRPRVVLAIFAAISIASGGAQVAFGVLRGMPVQPAQVLAHAAFIWMLFGALSFVAIWTARRFPLEPSRLATSAPAHLAAFIAMSMTHTALYLPAAHFLTGPERPMDPLLPSLILNLRGDIFLYGAMVGAYYLYAQIVAGRNRPAPATPPAAAPRYLTRIPLRDDGRVGFIDVADVERIEAEGDYVRIHTRKGARLLRQSLTGLEQQLDPAQFARVHRSKIIRLAAIGELQPMFHGEFVAIMASGARVKVSRTYGGTLRSALGLET